MPVPRKVSDEQIAAAVAEAGSIRGAAKLLGVDHTTLLHRGARAKTAPAPESLEAMRARLVDLEAQLAAQAPIVEEGESSPANDSLVSLVFDLHVPEQDPAAWASCLKWHREQQPNETILSEVAEWLSASQHGNSAWGAQWKQDVAAVRRALIQLRSVVGPDCRMTIQESNHDTRLTRILEDRLPSFAGALTIPRELGLADLGIEWVSERTVLRRGALKVLHGHQLESGLRGCLPKYHAARAIQKYGERGCTVVYGHTHKEQMLVEPFEGGFKRAVNIPCLRTLVPMWHKAREEGWSHGFGAAYIAAGGATNLYTINITGGSFNWAGRRYAA